MTIAELVEHVMPGAMSAPAPTWPPDVFALAGILLKNSGAYERVIHRWPPSGDIDTWRTSIVDVAERWRQRAAGGYTPPDVARWWQVVVDNANTPIHAIRKDPMLANALLELVAVADQTSKSVGFPPAPKDTFNVAASQRLEKTFSLSAINPAWVRVLPKAHNPLDGLSFRSLTHHLALWTNPEVDAKWKHYPMPQVKEEFNVLLLPWPLRLHPGAFRPADRSLGAEMPDKFGLFTYDAPHSADIARIEAIVVCARRLVNPIHAVVFPELSMTADDFDELRDALPDTLLIAGVGTPATSSLGSNEVAIAPPDQPWTETDFQSKHHRWRLDGAQFGNYGLKTPFDAHEWWWEAIQLPARCCTFFNVNAWLTLSVLICEDLARQDPIADLMRCVGPNLVITLLMDGPQMPDRWSARYATVLAEDPRSSVLTLTSAGMVDLSNAQFGGTSPRSIALWRDAASPRARQIHLQEGAEGVILRLGHQMKTEWTADGRSDEGSTGYIVLNGVFQVMPDPVTIHRPTAVT